MVDKLILDESQSLRPEIIRQLRYSFGESRADFARRFVKTQEALLSWQEIAQWESGELEPTALQRSQLIRLQQQAESLAEQTRMRPALELELKSNGLGQISRFRS